MKVPLILLVILGAMFILLFFIAPESESEPEVAESSRYHPPMFNYDADYVGYMEIIYEGRRAQFMKIDEGGWFRHEHHHHHHDDNEHNDHHHHHDHDDVEIDEKESAMIDNVVSFLTNVVPDQILYEQDDLARYGLVMPRVIVMLFEEEGEMPLMQWHVGSKTPSELAYYTQIPPDDAIYIVPRYQIDDVIEVYRKTTPVMHEH